MYNVTWCCRFDGLKPYTVPELLRVPLEELCLHIMVDLPHTSLLKVDQGTQLSQIIFITTAYATWNPFQWAVPQLSIMIIYIGTRSIEIQRWQYDLVNTKSIHLEINLITLTKEIYRMGRRLEFCGTMHLFSSFYWREETVLFCFCSANWLKCVLPFL